MLREREPVSISEWARTQRNLLKHERDEEREQVSGTIAKLSAQECMERGVSLVPLAIAGLSTGLYGRACLILGDPKGRPLPAHRLGAGDEVRLYSTKGNKGGNAGDAEEGVSEITGVVGKVTEATVEVISKDADEAGSLRAPLRLDVIASEATHKKLVMGLDALEKYPGGGPAERVIRVLFGFEQPSASAAGALRASSAAAAAAAGGAGAPSSSAVAAGAETETVPPALRSLNESQREAVSFALASRDVALIHGPPGTGKTTTVVALIREAVARGWRCLVCAPSNVAVDGILSRLVASEAGGDGNGGGGGGGGGSGGRRDSGRPRVVRMGHPARLSPQVLEHSIEALVSRHEGTAIVNDVRREIDKLLLQLHDAPGAGGGAGGKSRPGIRGADRKGARQEVKALRKEARAREGKVVREVLRSRNVVLATCVGAATHSLREEEFDLVVIDEAAQALEAACWIPILKGKRLVLAGDHKQLAPTVKSRMAAAGVLSASRSEAVESSSASGGSGGGGGADGLGLTMFDRVLRDLGHDVCRMLDVQYRMNRDICDWASNEMYDGLLRAHPSVAERALSDLPHATAAAAERSDMWAAVMLLVDTTGCDMPEEETGGGSRRNEREAEVAVRHVKGLLEAGILESEVAVISPYNGQVNLLKRLLRPEHPGVEIRSVDGFQGSEKEAIVLSLVRSNPGQKVGFLADARRLNVAVTRAKRHVAVVCDAECCGSDAFIGRLLRHIEDRGEYRSALELLQPDAGDTWEAPREAFEGGGGDDGTVAKPRGVEGGRAHRGKNEWGARITGAISDEDVLKLVQDFAERKSSQKGTEADDEEEDEDQEGEVKGEAQELELPPELTAQQRALVHETAEWLGLGHVSKGEGRHRVLVLSKGGGGRGGGGRAAKAVEEPPDVADNDTCSTNGGVQKAPPKGEVLSDDRRNEGEASGLKTGEEEAKQQEEYRAASGTASSMSSSSSSSSSSSPPSPSPPAAAATAGKNAAPARNESSASGPNTLLAALHAERAARCPPPPPDGSEKRGSRGKSATGRAAAAGGGPDADNLGFAVDLPGGGSRGGAMKVAPKKGGLASKRGKNKSGGAGAGGRGGRGGGGKMSGAKAASKEGSTGVRGGRGGDEGEDEDDDLAFLDAQIREKRMTEPCYASLLRSTTEVMRQSNPRWAAAVDKGKPAKSAITSARRNQLKGALEMRLAEEEKKRGKRAGEKG